MRHRVADEQGVRVMGARCLTCIFRPGNLMRLQSGRVRQMVESARRADSAIICHVTLDDPLQAVCRGFYELEEQGPTAPLQIATRLGMIVEWTR